MGIVRAIYSVIIDALFPLSEAEVFLRAIRPEDAASALSPAPPYDGSVVPLEHVRSLFAYKDERVSALIRCIKSKKDVHAFAIGGHRMREALKDMPEGSILVPMPITKRRRRERGYNQCELLVDAIIRREPRRFKKECDLLQRTVNASQQKLKNRKERISSSGGLFAAGETHRVSNISTVVVIDDVLTTGSTMKEAIDTLKKAGFADVRGLTLAH
jgi:ComF family protein